MTKMTRKTKLVLVLVMVMIMAMAGLVTMRMLLRRTQSGDVNWINRLALDMDLMTRAVRVSGHDYFPHFDCLPSHRK